MGIQMSDPRGSIVFRRYQNVAKHWLKSIQRRKFCFQNCRNEKTIVLACVDTELPCLKNICPLAMALFPRISKKVEVSTDRSDTDLRISEHPQKKSSQSIKNNKG
jgi:hypothetical protein